MRFYLFIILVFILSSLHAQLFQTEAERDIMPIENDSFSPTRIPSFYPQIIQRSISNDTSRSWLYRKAFQENFFTWKNDPYDIRIDPVIGIAIGKENDRQLSQNTRGFIINGQIEAKFTFRSEFYENQAVFPEYISNRIDSFEIIPGMVRAKPFGNNGYDYGMVFSQLIWQPADHYAFRFGYDRLHIGEGYRSFVLSDASHAYTFMSHHYVQKKWTISHVVASLRNPDVNGINHVPRSESGAYQQKWFTMTHISYSPFSFLNISLAENTVFMPWDSTKTQFYPVSLVPIPFLRTIMYEKKGPHHVINTLMLTWQLRKGLFLYSQFMGDELQLFKLYRYDAFQGAMQLGIKYQNPLNLKATFVAFEYNIANNNAYTSTSYWTAMTHADQPLGHPYGQQFNEWIFRGQLSLGRFGGKFHFSQLKGLHLPYSDSYYGIDKIFYASNRLFDYRDPQKVTHIRLEAFYTINPNSHLQIFGGIAMRIYDPSPLILSEKNTTIQVGIRHLLKNQNFDYF